MAVGGRGADAAHAGVRLVARFAASRAAVGRAPGAADRTTQDHQFAQARAEFARRLAEHGYDKKDKLDRAMLANELVDILAPANEALARARFDPDWFVDALGRDGLTGFVRNLPTRSVTLDLLWDKHAQGQENWEPNDLNDVVYLPIAAVHCDGVVTERQWANRLTRAAVPGATAPGCCMTPPTWPASSSRGDPVSLMACCAVRAEDRARVLGQTRSCRTAARRRTRVARDLGGRW